MEDAQGRTYWYNGLTGKSQWEKPDPPPKSWEPGYKQWKKREKARRKEREKMKQEAQKFKEKKAAAKAAAKAKKRAKSKKVAPVAGFDDLDHIP